MLIFPVQKDSSALRLKKDSQIKYARMKGKARNEEPSQKLQKGEEPSRKIKKQEQEFKERMDMK